LVGSVHIECMPDDPIQEAAWVHELDNSKVKAIVAGCDLTSPAIDAQLERLVEELQVRGIRWILDCLGKFEPNTATHVATTRHDGVDYLRGSQGGHDGDAVPEFERGFALLAKHGLSFDLQCAPEQLVAAAALFARHPGVPVCINHLGKPRTLLGPDVPSNTNTEADEQELEKWRVGMKAMAALPNTYVKLSMLGYAVPGWIRSSERIALVKQLVREVVDLFSPQRCMVALNWWKSGPVSDADFMSDVGPNPVELLQLMSFFFEGYSEEDRQRLFCGTAREFYKF
jgi:predicted TIM-barrel fold metal-dependent hydrolase